MQSGNEHREYTQNQGQATHLIAETVEKAAQLGLNAWFSRKKPLKVSVSGGNKPTIKTDIAKVRAEMSKPGATYDKVHAQVMKGPLAKASADPEYYADTVMAGAFQKEAEERYPQNAPQQELSPKRSL